MKSPLHELRQLAVGAVLCAFAASRPAGRAYRALWAEVRAALG